jgi:hypothetical protein
MTPFFILSLPRSRTAWLAAFLSYSDVNCYHEAIPRAGSLAMLRRWMGEAPIVGNSDCGNILVADKLVAMFPTAKFVVVRRNVSDVCHSLRRIGIPPRYRDLCDQEKALAKFAAERECMEISFDELESPLVTVQLAKYVLGVEMDMKRALQFSRLRIEVRRDLTARESAHYAQVLKEIEMEVV